MSIKACQDLKGEVIMEETKPQMEPMAERRKSVRSEMPTQAPAMESPPGGTSPVTASALAATVMMPPSDYAAPSLPITAGAMAGISAWQNNKKLTALWLNQQNRNSWIGVDGIGWKKLANTNDSSSVALTMLAAHAREKDAVVNYREESDNMIYEIYVW